MSYVAWIDVLGAEGIFFKKEREQEANVLAQTLVKHVSDTLQDQSAKFKVFGVNDGFYLICDDLSLLCEKAILIFQKWFDARGECINNTPLLRGAIAPLQPLCQTEIQKPIEYWAFARGLGVAFKTESILAGSRLFAHPDLRDKGIPENLVFSWNELSQSLLKVDPQEPLLELFWPFGGNGSTTAILERLIHAKTLYEQTWVSEKNELKKYIADRKMDKHEKALKIYMQYEETLKLCIRGVGAFAKDLPDSADKDKMLQFVKEFVAYDKVPLDFSWGLTFAALWACFAANWDYPCIRDSAHNFLDKKANNNGTWLGEFKKELHSNKTYKPFCMWLSEKDSRFKCDKK
ncbi:MAG TPA: hypothetical protein VK737_08685 [Opitutales bacterium]|nr:hypothetical protein [Opitutales bacterium]